MVITLEKPQTVGKFIVWQEKELELIRQYFRGTKSSIDSCRFAIKNATGIERTYYAIRHKAGQLGLTRFKSKPWTREQEETLADLVGKYSIYEVAIKLGRSANSIHNKLNDLKLSSRERDGWHTMGDICEILGIARGTVSRWICGGKLKSTRFNKNGVYKITKKNLRNFICEYPMEITGRNVDMMQLVAILCPKGVKG